MKPETIATAIEALEEFDSYLDPEWNDDDKEREARINAALADLRASQEQSAVQPSTPPSAPAMQPDWSKAPAWAMWWAVDANGAGWWYEYKPGETKDDWFSGRGNRMRSATPFVDWRATLRQRPDAASPGE